MKFLITESQIEKFVFKYLDNKNFIITEKGYSIYFFDSENNKNTNNYQIKCKDDYTRCAIQYELFREIMLFFSLDSDQAKRIITKWVEKTLGKEINSSYIH